MNRELAAGGDPSVQSCYLMATMNLDPSPGAMTYNWQPGTTEYAPNPEVRYTGGVPIMFESGTIRNTALPSEFYGCPYPPTANGMCTVSLFWHQFQMPNTSMPVFQSTSFEFWSL